MSINKINYGVEIFLLIIAALIVSAFFYGRGVGKRGADDWYSVHPKYEWIMTTAMEDSQLPAFIPHDRLSKTLYCVDEEGEVQTINTIMGPDECSDFDPKWYENVPYGPDRAKPALATR